MSKIRTQVMASVVLIYAARQLISPLALKAYGFLIALVALASTVSIGNVVANFFGVGLSGAAYFVFFAVTHTAAVVQFFTLAGAVFAILIARDIVRSVSRATPAFA